MSRARTGFLSKQVVTHVDLSEWMEHMATKTYNYTDSTVEECWDMKSCDSEPECQDLVCKLGE